MKIKLKTLKILGEKTYIGNYYDYTHFFGDCNLMLYPNGTKRLVKTFNFPSFKITEEYQIAYIKCVGSMDGLIDYNCWYYKK